MIECDFILYSYLIPSRIFINETDKPNFSFYKFPDLLSEYMYNWYSTFQVPN